MKNFIKLHNKAKKIIPGVSQLLGKRPDMFYLGINGPHIIQKQKE